MNKKEKTNIVQLGNRGKIPEEATEMMEKLAIMKSSYIEMLAVNILETVIAQSNAVGLGPDNDEESVYDIALIKESIMSYLSRNSGMKHKLQEYAEEHFEVGFDEYNDLLTRMITDEELDNDIENLKEDIKN